MPTIFCGHGNPLNALRVNVFTRGWTAVGESVPRPKAILAISAHWFRPAIQVTAMPTPPTIHDFRGFPDELYRMAYPADGDPDLARHIQQLLAPLPVTLDHRWGLDHGTWSVLTHMFPKADIPVVQLSIDSRLPPASHYEIGKRLSPLRAEDILIFASGNLVHALKDYVWDQPEVEPFDWALRFEQTVRERLLTGNASGLVHYDLLGEDARRAVPTPDHYLPFVYTAGLLKAGEPIRFPVEGFDGGSVSMLAVQIGE